MGEWTNSRLHVVATFQPWGNTEQSSPQIPVKMRQKLQVLYSIMRKCFVLINARCGHVVRKKSNFLFFSSVNNTLPDWSDHSWFAWKYLKAMGRQSSVVCQGSPLLPEWSIIFTTILVFIERKAESVRFCYSLPTCLGSALFCCLFFSVDCSFSGDSSSAVLSGSGSVLAFTKRIKNVHGIMLLKQLEIESKWQVKAEVQKCHWFCAVPGWHLSK